jgi:hypothetical protein
MAWGLGFVGLGSVREARTTGFAFVFSGFLTAGRNAGFGVGRLLRTGVSVRGVGRLGTVGRGADLDGDGALFTRGAWNVGRLGVEDRLGLWFTVRFLDCERWTGAACVRRSSRWTTIGWGRR